MASLYQDHHGSQYQQQQHSYDDAATESANSEGWVLYYTSEGHPYYYNEITGESQWANNEHEIVSSTDNSFVKYDTQNEEYAVKQQATELSDGVGDSGSDEESQGDSDRAETTSTDISSSDMEGRDSFNKEFEAYLQSPEGQQELEEERLTVEKYSATEPKKKKKPSRNRDVRHDTYAGEEEDLVLNAFGSSAFRQEEGQRQFQEQFMQQKRQQLSQYEQYEYHDQKRRFEEDQWEKERSNIEFAETYGLPPAPRAARSRTPPLEDSDHRHYIKEDRFRGEKRSNGKKRNSRSHKGRHHVHDDLEGGRREEREVDSSGSEVDSDSDGDSSGGGSVSSDDSDVQILREPTIPEWVSWRSLAHFVDRTVRDPVLAASSSLYSTLIPPPPPPLRPRDISEEEGMEYEGSDEDESSLGAEGMLDLQPLGAARGEARTVSGHKGGSNIAGSSAATSLYTSLSHYLSLSTLTTLFTTQQRDWLNATYAATSTAVWNFVTDSAERMVDGQPSREGQRQRSEPLPP